MLSTCDLRITAAATCIEIRANGLTPVHPVRAGRARRYDRSARTMYRFHARITTDNHRFGERNKIIRRNNIKSANPTPIIHVFRPELQGPIY
jgi:hypothetical protein